MLVCDFDGTLVGPSGEGLESAKEVIRLCEDRDVRFVIATGRAFGALEKYLEILNVKEPVITNGGTIVCALGEEPVFQKVISSKSAKKIARALSGLAIPHYFMEGKGMVTNRGGPETEKYSKMLGYPIRIDPALDVGSLTPTQVVVRLPKDRLHLSDLLTQESWLEGHGVGDVSALRCLPHLIEMKARGTSKVTGLEFLSERFGIKAREVLAIGDGPNDIDMLKWAGHSACTANADASVKACVPLVSRGNYGTGVLEIVKGMLG